MPEPVTKHCMVKNDVSKLMVIGGTSDVSNTMFSKTLIFDAMNSSWIKGPVLNFDRYFHSCGLIRQDLNSNKWSTIVVGGNNATGKTYKINIPAGWLGVLRVNF